MTHIIICPERYTVQDVADKLNLLNLVASQNHEYYKGEFITPCGIKLNVLIRSRIWVKPGLLVMSPVPRYGRMYLYTKHDPSWADICNVDWGEIELKALAMMLQK